MERKILAAFSVLGVIRGFSSNLAQLFPSLLANPPTFPQTADIASIVLGLGLGLGLYTFWPLIIAGVGYWAGSRFPVETQPVRFSVIVGAFGGLAFLLTTLVLIQLDIALTADSLIVEASRTIVDSIRVTISIGLLGLAGATIARFG